ncbi:hypothetical protein AAFF_G00327800 [Aldrovandia affinis]|uniref:Uncharacterized protein n=1 Tax=Aldrovandia affinis TaxID=143900 RepID=A0AAD7TAC2_9TELE|nr:hypothetical protein AAFF_G00327800 [Aldrovandia affinis]
MCLPNEVSLLTTHSDTYLLRTALYRYIYLQCSPLSEITLKRDFFAKRVHGWPLNCCLTSTRSVTGRMVSMVAVEGHMGVPWLSK